MLDKPALVVSGALAALIAFGSGVSWIFAAVFWLVGYVVFESMGRASAQQYRADRARARAYASDDDVRFDEDFVRPTVLNPTTGLQMVGNVAGGVDIGGHLWGEVAAFNDYSAAPDFDFGNNEDYSYEP